MGAIGDSFDPWGPISSVLYEMNDSDFVQNAIANTGIDIEWRPYSKADAYSHSTRIRALRRDISAAYSNLDEEKRGLFARIVVKSMLRRPKAEELRSRLVNRLSDIGWTISDDGLLMTEDALISEQFFPVNSEYDAYVAVRDVFARASTEIIIVDAYIGSSLLTTLKALPTRNLSVRVLTAAKNLKPDFGVEVAAFKRQVSHISLEIRTTDDFHDRFIVTDEREFYHVGASIKDAGKRAFMISRMQDKTNADNLRKYIDTVWFGANRAC
jgi:hypothetical protein